MVRKMTKAENEIIEAYKLTGMNPAGVSYARRALEYADPDILIMLDEDEIYDSMVEMKIVRESAHASKSRGKVKHYLRKFLAWLSEEFENGKHADTWFEPDWMEENI